MCVLTYINAVFGVASDFHNFETETFSWENCWQCCLTLKVNWKLSVSSTTNCLLDYYFVCVYVTETVWCRVLFFSIITSHVSFSSNWRIKYHWTETGFVISKLNVFCWVSYWLTIPLSSVTKYIPFLSFSFRNVWGT